LLEYSGVLSGRKVTPAPVLASDTLAGAGSREIRYWTLAAYLAAIGAAAATRAMPAMVPALTARAQKALERIQESWKGDAAAYIARPDLKELRRRAGLNTQS